MNSNSAAQRRMGVVLLLVSIVFCTVAQFMLKAAMNRVGVLPAFADLELISFLLEHRVAVGLIIVGLGLYGSGTILWILCLTRLELSFAYPISTLQYLLVFLAAWIFLGEDIHLARWLGMAVIAVGVVVMSADKTEGDHA